MTISSMKLHAQTTPRLQKTTQIYVLCRDRLEYARYSIASAVRQDADGVEVVVSDNSESEAVGAMVRREFPSVTYLRRWPTMSSERHFQTILKECVADYVVLFHDDDLLEPNYVSSMRDVLNERPTASAVACNAWIARNDVCLKKLVMCNRTEDTLLSTVEELLGFYLRLDVSRPAPFPGYMYRRKMIRGLYLSYEDGGKHSDVSFLMNVIQRGSFVWLAKPLMIYRMHDSNDSKKENVGQRLRLLRYIYRTTSIRPEYEEIDEFRFRYWLRWWRGTRDVSDKKRRKWRRKIVVTYLFWRSFWYLAMKRQLWSRLLTAAR